MNTSTVIDFIKARWRMIEVLAVASLIIILALLFVAGLFVLPAEITSSSGAITYNSTGIAEILKVKSGLVMCQMIGALASRIEFQRRADDSRTVRDST